MMKSTDPKFVCTKLIKIKKQSPVLSKTVDQETRRQLHSCSGNLGGNMLTSWSTQRSESADNRRNGAGVGIGKR